MENGYSERPILNATNNLYRPHLPEEIITEMVSCKGNFNCYPVIQGDTVIHIWFKIHTKNDIISPVKTPVENTN